MSTHPGSSDAAAAGTRVLDGLLVTPAVLLGAGLRLWLATRNAGLTMDSPLYARMAEAMARDEGDEG